MSKIQIKNPHALSSIQIAKQLGTDLKNGLTQKQAKEIQERCGQNKLPQESMVRIQLRLFFVQWKSPFLYLLLIAGIVSYFLGEHLDAAVVIFTAAVNAIVGFFQESKVSRVLRELSQYAPEYSEVLRDSRLIQIENKDVVPGDILFLREGDKISADARIISSQDFFVSEASLTGESKSVPKNSRTLAKAISTTDRRNMVYSGTTVSRGRAQVLVTATGLQTEIGHIAKMVSGIDDSPTPLQEQIIKLSKFVLFLVAGVAVLIFIIGIFQGRDLNDIFLIAVAVGIAAIPEGLIVSVTIILTVGMRRILARQALTRRLIAAETLGSVSVMCVDKTGTITEGQMSVTNDISSEEIFGENIKAKYKELMFSIVSLCSDAEIIFSKTHEISYRGDSTEVALLQASVRNKIYKNQLEKTKTRISTIAFDSQRKYMATLHTAKTNKFVYVKGAPEVVLEKCDSRIAARGIKKLDDSQRKQIDLQLQRMTSKGLRVMAVAYVQAPKTFKKLSEKNLPKLVFVGFVGMTDPVRPQVFSVIEQARIAGVRTIMITGDHVLTAKSVGKTVGLETDDKYVVTGAELEKMNEAKLKKIIRSVTIFARVEPRHKIRIVKALQNRGEVVAMTGDGVNDAPAIKAADIGIAVGSGTAVAKSVSDLVLLDNNVSTIVSSIEQGRTIFRNIRKVVLYLLSNMFTEAILIVGSLLLFLPLPITAVQILWINFITDGFPDVALAWDKGHPLAMRQPPRKRNTPIINNPMKIIIFIISILADVILLLFFVSIQGTTVSVEHMQTLMFLAVGMGSVLYIYSIRSLDRPVWQSKPFDNKLLNISQVFGILSLVVSVYVPQIQRFLGTVAIGAVEWIVVLVLALIKIAFIELIKWIYMRLAKTKHRKALSI